MTKVDESDREGESPQRKKPYLTPRLIAYGSAADLTGGGTGSVAENNPPHGPGSKHT
jgi:hypothetical protein